MLSGICCYRLPRRYAPRNDNAGDPLAARGAGEWAEKCASRTRIQAIALFARAQNGCQGGGIYGIFCKFGRLIASGPFFSGGRLGKAEWSEDKVV